MAKNSIDAYGASGKSNVLFFEPENLHLVTDKSHPLYDERIHLPISEAMVLNIMAQAMVSANEIRQADTPLGRAKKMADALERGHDEDDLALMFGVSVQTVRATLSLLDATQAVKDAVESGTVTVTQARQLASLKPEEQREKVAEIEQATAGTTGHEKARRQRQILGEAKPRLKTRKEITKVLEGATGDYAAALRWVLGEAV